MKVRVIQKFRDKETNEIRFVGDEFECTEERFEEILKVAPLVKNLDQANSDEIADDEEGIEVTREYLESLKVPELQVFAKGFGVEYKIGTTKAKFIDEIEEAMANLEEAIVNDAIETSESYEIADDEAETEE